MHIEMMRHIDSDQLVSKVKRSLRIGNSSGKAFEANCMGLGMNDDGEIEAFKMCPIFVEFSTATLEQ